MGKGWIGVDLDGTLAEYHGYRGPEHIGDPVPKMLARVKRKLAQGIEVKIFTARADDGKAVPAIHRWLRQHGIGGLQITNVKDADCIEIWDDRARQVVKNTGEFVG